MTAMDKLSARIAETPTAALVAALAELESQAATQETRLVRAGILTILEQRYPEAEAAIVAAFEADEKLIEQGIDGPEIDYVAVVVAAIPAADKAL